MIAGPSDTVPHVPSVREAIHRWNCHHAESRAAVLMPKHWQTSVAPDTGADPQDVVNEQMGICDVLIALFQSRLGTPTAKATSGTSEEIARHKAADKTVMIYWLQLRGAGSSLDLSQFGELQKAMGDWKRDMIVRENIDERSLEDQVYSDLTLHANRKAWGQFTSGTNGSSTPVSSASPVISRSALDILVPAAVGRSGQIVRGQIGNSWGLFVDGQSISSPTNARERAEVEDALGDLIGAKLLSGGKDIYTVTTAGYRCADAHRRAKPHSTSSVSRFISRRPPDPS